MQNPSSLNRRNFCTATAGIAGAAFATTIGFNRVAQAADADSDATITQIAKFKLNMDNEEEAVAALHWEEPWMLISSVTRSGTEDLMQKVSLKLEILKAEAAVQPE